MIHRKDFVLDNGDTDWLGYTLGLLDEIDQQISEFKEVRRKRPAFPEVEERYAKLISKILQ